MNPEEKEKTVKRLLDQAFIISRSEKTVRAYRYGIERFKRATGVKDMDRFVEDAKAGKIRAADFVVKFIASLDKQGLSRHTVRTWLNPVRVLLKNEGVEIRNHRLKVWAITPDVLPTKEQLQKMVAVASPRDRAALTMLVSSGLRAGELCNLTIGDLDRKTRKIRVRPEHAKERKGRISFYSHEAAKYLADYLEIRRDEGEALTKKSALFVTEPSKNSLGDQSGKPLTVARLGKLIRKLGQRAGAESQGEGSRTRYSIHTHVLRHFFITQSIANGCPAAIAHHLAGHSRYMGQYENYSEEDLRREYEKAEQALTITSIAADATAAAQIAALRENGQDKDARIAELEAEIGKLRELAGESNAKAIAAALAETKELLKKAGIPVPD